MNNTGQPNIKKPLTKPRRVLIKELLAQYLGVETEDIDDDDSLVDDLHVRTTDLVDFVESLGDKGLNTSSLDLTKIDTVAELIESLISEEYLE